MRLIDADKLLAALDDLRRVHLEDGTYDLVEQIRYATAVKIIEEMATEVRGRAEQPEAEERYENLGGTR